MCGRFTRKEKFHQLAEQVGLKNFPPLEPRYNIAPSQLVACVRTNPESKVPEYKELKWGLVPSWAKDSTMGNTLINARAETVATKPAFRKAFKQQRCLVLADGFYEWKPEGKVKQPYYIRFKDHRPFVFAGIWDNWEKETEQPLESCAIITAVSNTLTAFLHERMPVILHPQDYDLWLNPHNQNVQLLTSVLRPYPPEEMEAFPITPLVNSPRHEDPQCIHPLE